MRLLALLLVVSMPQLCPGQAARIYEGAWSWDNPASVTVSEEEIFPNPPYTRDWQSRSIFFLGHLDNGTFILINLFHWRFSVIQQWGLQVLATDGQGRVYQRDATLAEPAAEASPANGISLRFGETQFASRGADHRFRVALPGFTCDLSIHNILSPWKPGNGWAYYTEDRQTYSRYVVPAPWATMSGLVTVFGETARADGQCFWDSNLSVMPLSTPNSPVYSMRAFSPAGATEKDRVFINLLETVTSEQYGSTSVPILYVAQGSRWLFTTNDFSLIPTGWVTLNDPPYPYPGRYFVHARRGGYSLDGEFTASRLYLITDVFDRLPRFLRDVASLFLKRPVFYRMVGSFAGQLVSPEGLVTKLNLPAHAEYVISK